MGINIWDVMAKLSLDSSGYEKGLKNAQNSQKDFVQSAEQTISGANNLDEAIRTLQTQYNLAQAQVRLLTKELSSYVAESGGATGASEELASLLAEQQMKADDAKSAISELKKSQKEMGESADDAKESEKELADKEKDAAEKAEEQRKRAEELKKELQDGLAKAAQIAAGAMAALATAAIAGVVSLGKSAVEGYAEYEQLAGGVEKLFNDGASSIEEYAASVGRSVIDVVDEYNALDSAATTVMRNAANAYATAGMSANQYMQSAIQYSGMMLTAVGGDSEEAARMIDVAMVAMSDNVNALGTDMGMVQNAFRGISMGNYRMLDNLQLGYKGTQAEMERLIEDANEYAVSIGLAGDLSMDSFADQVQAIQLIQEKLGIAGTTANEAATTIQGSLGMLSAAWQNLVTGIANPDADMGVLINNLVDSAVTAFGNLMPAIENAMTGIATFVGNIAPIIAERLPAMIENVLPSFIGAFTTLFSALVRALPSIISMLVEQLPIIVDAVVDVVPQLISALLDLLPMIVETGITMILSLLQGIADMMPTLIEKIVGITIQLITLLTSPDTILGIVNAGIAILLALVQGILSALPQLIASLPTIITNILNSFLGAIPLIMQAGIDLLTSLIGALPDIISTIVEALPQVITGIINAFLENIPLIINAGIDLFIALIEALPQIIQIIVAAIPQIIGGVIGAFANAIPDIMQAGKDLFISIVTRIPEVLTAVVNAVASIITTIVSYIASAWDTVKQAGVNLFNKISEGIMGVIDGAKNWGRDLIQNFIDGITAMWNNLKAKIEAVANLIGNFLGFSEPEEGPLSNFHTFAPDMMQLFAQGIRDNERMLQDTVADAFDFQPTINAGMNLDSADYQAGLDEDGGTARGAVFNVTINMDASKVQNPRQFAEQMAEELQAITAERGLVWA